MKGRRQFKEGFLSLERIKTWIVYVCHSKGEWTTKYLSAFEQGMVVGARHTGLSASRTAMLLGFSHSKVSWPTTQRTSSQLDTLVGTIGVHMGQHPRGMLSTSCRVHALTKSAWWVQLNNSKVFLMFCTLGVH